MPSCKTIFNIISKVRTCVHSAVKPRPCSDSVVPEARAHPVCSKVCFQACCEVADVIDKKQSGPADLSL